MNLHSIRLVILVTQSKCSMTVLHSFYLTTSNIKVLTSRACFTFINYVCVLLQDYNDNSPAFENVSYSVEIFENATVGSKVLQVKAKDPDVEQDISYSIVKGNDALNFLIDSCTGIIYLRSEVNYDPPDTDKIFQLVVSIHNNFFYNQFEM